MLPVDVGVSLHSTYSNGTSTQCTRSIRACFLFVFYNPYNIMSLFDSIYMLLFHSCRLTMFVMRAQFLLVQ